MAKVQKITIENSKAKECMVVICHCSGNKDLEGFIPTIIKVFFL